MGEIPEFVNREKELKQFKVLLSGRPNFVYLVYGPINSGKTALLMKVLEELSERYQVFYINFRWRDVQDIEDLIKVLFRVKRGVIKEEIKEFIREFLKSGARALERFKGIPIPENIFDLLFRKKDKVEDIFAFLEEYFGEIKKAGYQPVLVVDELQTIKEVINTTGKPVIARLFNFFIGMTKEKHLCHCFCATSDCLFIEDIYENARLEGRAQYLLIDDLQKEKAYEVYEKFGFQEKDYLWEWIGGKIGDMVMLYEKKQILSEKEAVRAMKKEVAARLRALLERVQYGKIFYEFKGERVKINVEKIKESLKVFKKEEEVDKEKIHPLYRNYLVSENVLFYNPLEGKVRPQSRVLWRVIREVV